MHHFSSSRPLERQVRSEASITGHNDRKCPFRRGVRCVFSQPGFGSLAKNCAKSGGYNQRRLRHSFSLAQLEVLAKGTFNYRCKDISGHGS